MNKIITNEDVHDLKRYESTIFSAPPINRGDTGGFDGRGTPGLDSMVKWSAIIEATIELKSKFEKILEAGCGPSNLTLILAKIFPSIDEIYCLDLHPMSPLLQENVMCKCFIGDFFEQIKNVHDDTLDLIVDSCSVTHFDINSNLAPNDGCFKLAKEAMRTLKSGGFYITCSDFCTNGNKKGEFVDVDTMIATYEAGGLKLHGERPKQNTPWINNCNWGVVRLVFTKP